MHATAHSATTSARRNDGRVPNDASEGKGCRISMVLERIHGKRGWSSINRALGPVFPSDLQIRPRLMKLKNRLLEKRGSEKLLALLLPTTGALPTCEPGGRP